MNTTSIKPLKVLYTRCKDFLLYFLYAQKHWVLIALTAYLAADLLILFIRPILIPTSHRPVLARQPIRSNSIANYKSIIDLNIFHNAPIPVSLSSLDTHSPRTSGQPLLSGLPLALNGTIVYENELYSIANISISNNTVSNSYYIGEKIDKLARITRIESERIYFINLNSNTEEYIEVPDLHQINFQFKQKKPVDEIQNTDNGFVKHLGDFNFQIKRSVVNNLFHSLPDVLQQATVVPRWENGELIGYEFKYIEPDSPYEKIGLKKHDIIESVNGEKILSAVQATELFMRVKNRSNINMTIQREGKQVPFSWSINEDVSITEPSALQ